MHSNGLLLDELIMRQSSWRETANFVRLQATSHKYRDGSAVEFFVDIMSGFC